ncbi:integrase [Leptolyngbya sp. FACHB-261]|uniref:integrase n=1 Tax=Leptolyngbya sp. FACHB-261 TaxID=2692806 RepID=UPI0016848A8B|nr:integrase [Leptolyngbya sp. FACHB-261]MBD2105313.1 integrase [Leptolyngbya sp. FACHB-261]
MAEDGHDLVIDEAIQQANQRLKDSRLRISLMRRGGAICVQATFPPKPGSVREKPHQQKLALGLDASLEGVAKAEKVAQMMGAELALDQFKWSDWLKPDLNEGTCFYWSSKLEEQFWAKHKPKSRPTWEKDYKTVLRRLPPTQQMTPALLRRIILETEPDSKNRTRTVMVCNALAKCAGLPVSFSDLRGKYSMRRVSARELPSDELIASYREQIKNKSWQWVYGAMAVWGLRPHEVFHLDLREFPVVEVSKFTKTGRRYVYPLYPEWAEQWKLQDIKLPNLEELNKQEADYDNSKLGTKVSGWFSKNKVPFQPYELRHCWARRAFEFALPPDFAAVLMGHSVTVHCEIYRAWIGEQTYRRAYHAIINRADRPQAPTILRTTSPSEQL